MTVYEFSSMPILLWIGVKDWRALTIPDLANFLLLVLSVLKINALDGDDLPVHLGFGAVVLFAFWYFGQMVFEKSGREGLGIGDAKLLAVCAVWSGPIVFWPVLFVSSVGGVIFALARMSLYRTQRAVKEIPFGCFIAATQFIFMLIPAETIL